MEQNNLRGALAMLASMAFLIVNDAIVKFVASGLPIGEIIFVRGLMATLIMTFAAAMAGELKLWRTLVRRSVLLRTAGEVIATLLYLTALTLMAIGSVTAILQIVPLVATAGSALFLAEKVGLRRWVAAIIGFAGVMLIIKPGTSEFNFTAILPLVSVLFIALRDIATRAMPGNVPSLLITALTAAAVSIAGLGLGLTETWAPVSLPDLTLLVAASVCILGGYYFIILSMRIGEISIVAPFRYSIVIWAILLGYFIWDEIPDLTSFAGISIIICAGIYTFQRESRAKFAKIAKE